MTVVLKDVDAACVSVVVVFDITSLIFVKDMMPLVVLTVGNKLLLHSGSFSNEIAHLDYNHP